MKECLDFEVEVIRLRDRPKKTWSEVIEKGCQIQQIFKEDSVDRRKWRKLIKDVVNSHKDRVSVSECISGTCSPGSFWIKGR